MLKVLKKLSVKAINLEFCLSRCKRCDGIVIRLSVTVVNYLDTKLVVQCYL